MNNGAIITAGNLGLLVLEKAMKKRFDLTLLSLPDGKTMGLYQVTVRKEDKTIAYFTGLAFKK